LSRESFSVHDCVHIFIHPVARRFVESQKISIARAEDARVNLAVPVAVLIWVMIYPNSTHLPSFGRSQSFLNSIKLPLHMN